MIIAHETHECVMPLPNLFVFDTDESIISIAGGLIYVGAGGNIAIESSYIINIDNEAINGAIVYGSPDNITISDCVIDGIKAGNGGIIYIPNDMDTDNEITIVIKFSILYSTSYFLL